MDLVLFEGLFRQFYPRLKRYALHIVENSQEAEDLVQEVFFYIWKHQDELDKNKNIPAFLFTIIRNKCLNFLKKKIVEEKYVASQAKFETEELYHISFNGQEEFISLEQKLHEEIGRIIAKMPPQCGVAFRLRWIDGKKIREIASEMGISTTMTDRHLAKGLEIAKHNLNSNLLLYFMVFYPKS